jgi:hypothetical protein
MRGRRHPGATGTATQPQWCESPPLVTVNVGQVTQGEDAPGPPQLPPSLKARSAKAGVRTIPFHGTRHTCGSLLAALDVHPRVAMQILRHSKVAVTMEIYTHIPSDLTRTALHRLGDQLEALG